MDYLSMLILGVIQGIAEFLPISSSGHLALAKVIMKDNADIAALGDALLLLDILLHLATLGAVFLFFRKQIKEALIGTVRLLKAAVQGRFRTCLNTDHGARIAWCIVVATIPTGILGVLLKDVAEKVGTSPFLLGIAFLGCAGLLLLSRFMPGGQKRLTVGFALTVGIAQGIAVLPGLSRSGTTIAVALALGLQRKESVSFSFILSVPAILGAAFLEMDMEKLAFGNHLAAYGIGCATAFAVGLVALFFFAKTVDNGRLWWFSPYVAAVGIGALILSGKC